MITLDTNILVRYLVRDVVEQADAASRLLEALTAERPGYICREVAIELVWVLERTYHFSRHSIASIVEEMVGSAELAIENSDDVLEAVAGYRLGSADFQDLMILAAARRVGAEPVYTFDRKFSRVVGAELLDPPSEEE